MKVLKTLWKLFQKLLVPTKTNREATEVIDRSALRGEESEARVFKVIQEMLVWKELPTRKAGTFPYRTGKNSRLDHAGIDIVVPTKRGDIFIQVKSSKYGVSQFYTTKRKYKIICLNGQEDELTILRELRTRLPIAYRRLQNDHT